MAKQTWVKVNGTWKTIKNIWENVNGTWKENVISKLNVSRGWRECIKYGEERLYHVYRGDGTSSNYMAELDLDTLSELNSVADSENCTGIGGVGQKLVSSEYHDVFEIDMDTLSSQSSETLTFLSESIEESGGTLDRMYIGVRYNIYEINPNTKAKLNQYYVGNERPKIGGTQNKIFTTFGSGVDERNLDTLASINQFYGGGQNLNGLGGINSRLYNSNNYSNDLKIQEISATDGTVLNEKSTSTTEDPPQGIGGTKV